MDEKPKEIEPSYIFDATAVQAYCDGLKSEENIQQLQELLQNNSLSALNMGSALKSLLMENAGKCKIRQTNNKSDKSIHDPWFDRECKEAKNAIRKLGKDLKKEPNSNDTRFLLQNKKKSLKKMVSSKKRKYKQNITDKLSQSHKSQREFWKLLDKLSAKKEKISSYVSHKALTNHFKTLLNTTNPMDMSPKCQERGPLDDKITLDELTKASETLKPRKAVAIDNINNEMLGCLLDICPSVILKLFNLILDNNDVLPDWLISFIVPIHKGGPKSAPSNYHGISLLSCLGKLFLSIINKRLAQYALENGIISLRAVLK